MDLHILAPPDNILERKSCEGHTQHLHQNEDNIAFTKRSIPVIASCALVDSIDRASTDLMLHRSLFTAVNAADTTEAITFAPNVVFGIRGAYFYYLFAINAFFIHLTIRCIISFIGVVYSGSNDLSAGFARLFISTAVEVFDGIPFC
jgi:hypothetical protein